MRNDKGIVTKIKTSRQSATKRPFIWMKAQRPSFIGVGLSNPKRNKHLMMLRYGLNSYENMRVLMNRKEVTNLFKHNYTSCKRLKHNRWSPR